MADEIEKNLANMRLDKYDEEDGKLIGSSQSMFACFRSTNFHL